MNESETEPIAVFNSKLIRQITENLMVDYNITFEDFVKYEYCGRHRGDDKEDSTTEAGERYFEILFGERAFPEIQEKCICEHDIIINCYVTKDINIKDGLIVIVGSCCIENFLEKKFARLCSECKNPHKNRKDNLCNSCRLRLIKKYYHIPYIPYIPTKKINELLINKYYKIYKNEIIQSKYGVAILVWLRDIITNEQFKVFLPKRYNNFSNLNNYNLAYKRTIMLDNGYKKYEIDLRLKT